MEFYVPVPNWSGICLGCILGLAIMVALTAVLAWAVGRKGNDNDGE